MAITKYVDQKWPADTPVEGEQLSVNGYYTGEHMGTPMQDGMYPDANTDPYYVEHVTVRYGTMTQDGASDANMPVKSNANVTNKLTGCVGNGGAAVQGTDYTATYTALEGYELPATITVKNGGSPLTVTTDYTWTQGTGVLKVTGSKITGDLEITITATEAD